MRVILLSIVLLSGILRLYNLSFIPPSPSLDEVSIGYNAYSILQTGRDEYGNFLPVLLRAYDDWRPGLYVYLVIPFLPIFGLSAAAVRLPSALLSIGAVVLTYFIVKEILQKKEIAVLGLTIQTEWIALTASFLLAISPWHIYLSRLGHEVNLGLTAVMLGVYFFIKAIHEKNAFPYAVLSSISFVVSLYGYQSQKVIVPLLLLGILLLFLKEICARLKTFFVASVVGFVMLIPLLIASSDPQALVRFKATSAFTGLEQRYQASAERVLDAREQGNLIEELANNRRLVAPTVFLENYFSHFNPWWLFTNSGDEQHKAPGLGLLYIWELLFIPIGVIVFLHTKLQWKYKAFIVLWFLSAPLAAALTTGAPHAMRSYTFLPLWQIFSGMGIIAVAIYLKKIVPEKVVWASMALVGLLSVLYFSYQYYLVFPHAQSSSFQYALGQTIPYVEEKEGAYEKVVYSNKDALYQSYMFYLFYTKFDPEKYLALGGTKSGGYAEPHEIGKYEFREIVEAHPESETLYIVNPGELNAGKTITIFSNLNDDNAVEVIEAE